MIAGKRDGVKVQAVYITLMIDFTEHEGMVFYQMFQVMFVKLGCHEFSFKSTSLGF